MRLAKRKIHYSEHDANCKDACKMFFSTQQSKIGFWKIRYSATFRKSFVKVEILIIPCRCNTFVRLAIYLFTLRINKHPTNTHSGCRIASPASDTRRQTQSGVSCAFTCECFLYILVRRPATHGRNRRPERVKNGILFPHVQ